MKTPQTLPSAVRAFYLEGEGAEGGPLLDAGATDSFIAGQVMLVNDPLSEELGRSVNCMSKTAQMHKSLAQVEPVLFSKLLGYLAEQRLMSDTVCSALSSKVVEPNTSLSFISREP